MRARIALLVRARLEALAPHREAIRRAVVARAHAAATSPGTGRSLWRTVDLMWRRRRAWPAIRSDGFGYYSPAGHARRRLVATFLYWLEDQSEGCADSWAFLDRRIEGLLQIGRLRSTVDGWAAWLTWAPAGGRRARADRAQ